MKLFCNEQAALLASGESTSDEITRAAQEMLRKHPSDAIIRAEARYDALLAQGKVDRAITWWRVKQAIAGLRTAERNE